MELGIIGGTRFYSMAEDSRAQEVQTPYGAAAVDMVPVAGQEVAFIARHGREHDVPPHLVNYRANIAALKALGVTRVLASAAVGSLNPAMQPGEFALLTQFIDFTRGRQSTFFDGAGGVRHTDMSTPYCPQMRQALQHAADFLREALHPAAVYVCTDGPRFETPAEIEMFQRLGGDVVGMTGVPEAPLAREAGLCYASLAVITNWAAGLSESPLDHDQVLARMDEHIEAVKRVFIGVIEAAPSGPCPVCRPAAAEGR